MTVTRRVAVPVLVAALVAAACADGSVLDEFAAGTTTTPPREEVIVSGGVFAIPDATAPVADATPLPVAADHRIGTLDNGLTYLLRSNDRPGRSVELRLVVDAGSAQQFVADDGVAHFLEHMMFNGTEAFPANDLSLQLQRLGISFGPDFNAYTSFDETVYNLSASTEDPAAVDIAFRVLAQWASAATLDPAQVSAEIGVVRDELRRSLESVDGIVADELNQVYIDGSGYEGRIVIGAPERVEATEAAALREFYDAWYRPDNMAVVVVGDLPVAEMAALVEQHFGGLGARVAEPPARTATPAPLRSEPTTTVITHPDNAFDNLSFDLPMTVWDAATVGGDRLRSMESLIIRILGNRLRDAYLSGVLALDDEPSLGEFTIARGLRYLGTNLTAPDLGDALDELMAELLGAAVDGFTADDVERAVRAELADLDDEGAEIPTIQDWQFAADLAAYWLAGADIDDPGERLDRRREYLDAITADELTNHWRWMLHTAGPIVAAIGADANALPTAAELRAIIDEAAPASSRTLLSDIDTLLDAPPPVTPAATRTRDTTDGTVHEWSFPNGVDVSFQRSGIRAGQIEIFSEGTGGWSLVPPATNGANAAMAELAVAAVTASGVGDVDPAPLRRHLETRAVGIGGYIDESGEGLQGFAAADDAETFFALFHLLVAAPRVDEVALREALGAAERTIATGATDVTLRSFELLTELATGDPRFSLVPTSDQLAGVDAELLLDIYRSRLGAVDDLRVAIVGDLDASTVLDLASRYLGTIPTRVADPPIDLGIELPTGVRTGTVELSEGTANGGLIVAHSVAAELTSRERVAAELLRTVIDTRITDVIREELGASYGGFANLFTSSTPVPNLTSVLEIDGDPARLDEIRGATLSILSGLAADGVTTDEFRRAAAVLEEDWRFVDNGLFLDTNLAFLRDPGGDHLTADNRLSILAEMKPADVQLLAVALYGAGDRIEVAKVLP